MSIFADVRCVVITDNASRFLYSRFYGKDGETPEFCEHFKRTIVSKAKKSTTEPDCIYSDDMLVIYRSVGSVLVFVGTKMTSNEIKLATYINNLVTALNNLVGVDEQVNRLSILSRVGDVAILVDETVHDTADGGVFITLSPPDLSSGVSGLSDTPFQKTLTSGLSIAKEFGRALLR